MARLDPAIWSEQLRHTLARYDELLLRQVAAALVKPRSQWPVEELIDRCVATMTNVAVIDRRLKDLDPACRRLLAAIARSGQPRWRLGSLVEISAVLGHADPLAPLVTLLQNGLLWPCFPPERTLRLPSFEHWMGGGGTPGLPVFAHPAVAARCLGEDLGLPALAVADGSAGAIQEADGLEWPLRLAVLWQLVTEAPLRRTQQGDFFKRDLERLTLDLRLNTPPAEELAELPDAALLTASLARLLGLVTDEEGELRAAAFPPEWEQGLSAMLEALFAALPWLAGWDAHRGSRAAVTSTGNPNPSAWLLMFLLLARLPEDAWARPDDLEQWIIARHPYWPARKPTEVGLRTFLLGFAYPLRLLQATHDPAAGWLVRLSPFGRAFLGLAELQDALPEFGQTLTVQPNLEIVAYRQGLTLPLIARLSRFARWVTLGQACLLQLQPETVYRALEGGLTFEDMRHTLERHGMRALPPAVVEALRTWATKRDRLTVHASSTLFEFGSAEELNDALARGLPGIRLSDSLALVADESAVDFKHFRLTGSRDYGLPPEKCVEIGDDGVTLSVELARSDLFLETELRRFAEPVDTLLANGRRKYRVTPATLEAGRAAGLNESHLHEWFRQRAGKPLSAACHLLLTASQMPPLEFRRQLVVHVATEELADGLCQWPETRSLIEDRLGPTALAVLDENAATLRERVAGLGAALDEGQAQNPDSRK